MTRDEAIKVMQGAPEPKCSDRYASNWIDVFIALGMLKVDPKIDELSGRFTDVYLQSECANTISAFEFLDRLSAAGLKIVEANDAADQG